MAPLGNPEETAGGTPCTVKLHSGQPAGIRFNSFDSAVAAPAQGLSCSQPRNSPDANIVAATNLRKPFLGRLRKRENKTLADELLADHEGFLQHWSQAVPAFGAISDPALWTRCSTRSASTTIERRADSVLQGRSRDCARVTGYSDLTGRRPIFANLQESGTCAEGTG